MEAGNTKHLAWKPVLIRFIAQLFPSKAMRMVQTEFRNASKHMGVYLH